MTLCKLLLRVITAGGDIYFVWRMFMSVELASLTEVKYCNCVVMLMAV